MVGKKGVEPLCLTARHFKCLVYTSSTTFRIIYGECTWSWTRDLRIKNPLLYLLSYTFVVVSPEFESGTARLSSVCSTAELWNVNWKALIDSNYRIMESKSIVLTNFTKCPLKDYKNLDRELFFENSKLLRVYLKHGSSRNVASIIKN